MTHFDMTIIKSNRSLKNKDKKYVITRKIIKEFEVQVNRLKNHAGQKCLLFKENI
jgi:hypothetical protein